MNPFRRLRAQRPPRVESIYVRWSWMRAVLHNGWWLCTSLYLVVDGGLSASQLVFVGVAQGIAALVFEIPAGVFADTVSRRWSLVISHLLMGTAMLSTALFTSFWPLVATQMLWGISWNFASGADTAWVTDELRDPAGIDGVLARGAQAQLSGAAVGMVVLGALGWAAGLRGAMVVAGSAMLVLGVYVLASFRERRFAPESEARWNASWRVFVDGLRLVRKSRTILVIFAATFVSNGAADAYGRMFPKQLTAIGFPTAAAPIAWLTALGVLALILGVAAVRFMRDRTAGARAARNWYAIAAAVGTGGLMVLACSRHFGVSAAGVLVAGGVAFPVTRILATIQVNRLTADRVRATVHSFLAQAEYLGEIVCGAAVGVAARLSGMSTALAACAALLAVAAAVILSVRVDRAAK